MLLILLIVVSSVVIVVCAVSEAVGDHATLIGYCVAVAVGALLAACNAWGMNRLVARLAKITVSMPPVSQEWAGSVFWAAVMLVWLPLIGFVATWCASIALRVAGS